MPRRTPTPSRIQPLPESMRAWIKDWERDNPDFEPPTHTKLPSPLPERKS